MALTLRDKTPPQAGLVANQENYDRQQIRLSQGYRVGCGSACLRVPDTLQVSMGEKSGGGRCIYCRGDKKQPGDRLPRLRKEHTWQYVPVNTESSVLLLQVFLLQLQPDSYGIIQGNT
jgi:hypothetical protein